MSSEYFIFYVLPWMVVSIPDRFLIKIQPGHRAHIKPKGSQVATVYKEIWGVLGL